MPLSQGEPKVYTKCSLSKKTLPGCPEAPDFTKDTSRGKDRHKQTIARTAVRRILIVIAFGMAASMFVKK